MKAIPRARAVRQALRTTEIAVRDALKELNKTAGDLMAKGDYTGAEALAAKGRQIQEFRGRIRELRREWKELRTGKADNGEVRGKSTPLWAYYQSILRALVEAGGAARRTALEPVVRKLLQDTVQPGDDEPLARGQARWQVMIRRARKPMVAEGWLEPGVGPTWRITDSGRRSATNGSAVGKLPQKTLRRPGKSPGSS